MADTTNTRPVDDVTAAPRPKPAFAVPQAPAQAAKRRRLNRKWLVRGIVTLVLLVPLVALAVAADVIYQANQPQVLHRTHITPVVPKPATPTQTTTKK